MPRSRFTIRSVMLAVAVAAGLLAVVKWWGAIAIAISLTFAALFHAFSLFSRGHRRPAAFWFWVPIIVSNIFFVGCCASPELFFIAVGFGGWLIFVMPAILGFGIAWAILATRAGVVGQRSPLVAWISLVTLMVAPVATVRTLWPLHMAFYFAKPKLELLANQIESGQVIAFPQWIGPFRLAGSKVDVATGNVGLVTYPNSSGPTGFVRVSAATPNQNRHIPIRGDIFEVELGPGWWYHEED